MNKKLKNLTKDLFSDSEPTWDNDSNHIFFVSDRADKTQLHTFTTKHRLLEDESIYQKDIYKVSIDSMISHRITHTPGWNEHQPSVTKDGNLLFNSDRNGIQNIYVYLFDEKEAFPLTDLQSGVSQFCSSTDGNRISFTAINKGYLDIFLLKSPLNRKKDKQLKENYWALRRISEPQSKRVPATLYAQEMFEDGVISGAERANKEEKEREALGEVEEEFNSDGEIDFRDYVFSEIILEDTTLELEDL